MSDRPDAQARQRSFDHLVLQGGGIRCFWQAGFLSRIKNEIALQPKSIYAVSAGAGIACAFVADRLEFSTEWFKAAASRNTKNFYPEHLFSSKPAFPQAGIYRRLLEAVFEGDAFQKLQQGSEVHVLLTRPPRRCPAAAVVPLGALLLAVRMHAPRAIWTRVKQWSGFRSEYVSTKQCSNTSEVADLILASSCTPPMTPLYRLGGRPSLDGGLLESVPRSALTKQRGANSEPAGRTLILMTQAPTRALHSPARELCVHPAQPLNASPWDYTNPAAIDTLIAAGRKDAEAFLRTQAPRS